MISKIAHFVKNTLLIIGIFCIVIFSINYFQSIQKSKARLAEADLILPESWDEPYKSQKIKDKYKIIILTTWGGEWTHATHLKASAERMGWEVKIYHQSLSSYEDEILKFNPDFIIYASDIDHRIHPEVKNLKTKFYGIYYYPIDYNITRSFNDEILLDKDLKPENGLLEMFNLADGMLINNKRIKIFETIFNDRHRKFYGINIIPTVSKADYKPLNFNYVTEYGHHTADLKTKKSLQYVLKKLDKDKILKTYGKFKDYSYIPHSYKGYVPDTFQMIDLLNKNGVALVFHSKFNYDGGTPTTRLLEAFAASALVITDRNPFTVRNFGDNVLYFDTYAESEILYRQIKDHYDWAQNHPEEARAKASRAHDIFIEKFTTEIQLIRIAKLHEKILDDEKAMNLEFPFKP